MKLDTIYLIPEYKLRELLEDSNKLAALECGGVDNWDWYGYSIHNYIEDFCKNNYDLVKETFGEEDMEDFGIREMSELELLDFHTITDLSEKIGEVLGDIL